MTPRQEWIRGYAIEIMRDLLARGIIEKTDSIPKVLALLKDEVMRVIVPDIGVAILDIGATMARGGAERLFAGSGPIASYVANTLDQIFGEHGKQQTQHKGAARGSKAAREAAEAMMALAREIGEDR